MTTNEETQTAPTIGAPLQPSRDAPRMLSATERYPREHVLGEGGMGEVFLSTDLQIGRQVAVKTLRPELRRRPAALSRFVREARVQGQLEHPAMVPVYDLAIDDAGEVFFTMKRVRGRTLADVITGCRHHPDRYDRHRLLTDFGRICLAVDFAHERGVVHRDLKPANIMLGDYGEVYVLDWGIAKVAHQSEDAALEVETTSATQTSAGTMMGTPGYLAPEQARSAAEVDRRADIYSLGCILFEIATLRRLHEGDPAALIRSTLKGVDASASTRAPDMNVDPELDAICIRATQQEPSARYSSAREMFVAIDRILKGQRDEQLRRELASAHTQRARDLADSTLDGRREAMRELGRALALDPQDGEAFAMVARLMRELPTERPDEVRVALLESEQRQNRGTARIATVSYGALALFAPLVFSLDVQIWSVPVCFFVLALICTALTAYAASQPLPPTPIVFATFILSSIMLLTLWKFYGPFIIVAPGLVANTAGYVLLMQRGWRWTVIGIGVLCIAGPAFAEFLGWVSPSYLIEPGGITIVASVIEFEPLTSVLFICLAHASSLIIACGNAVGVRKQLSEAEERLYLQDWHLRALVPASLERKE